MDNFTESGSGYFIAYVTAGEDAIPIEDAYVEVRRYLNENEEGGEVIYSLKTNPDGKTVPVELSAPSKTLSQYPGSDTLPYSEYSVTVIKDGYSTVENIGIPIFDGVVAIQPIALLPLTEKDLYLPYESEIIVKEQNSYEKLRNDRLNS